MGLGPGRIIKTFMLWPIQFLYVQFYSSPPITFHSLLSHFNSFHSKPSQLDSLSSVIFHSISFTGGLLHPFLSWFKKIETWLFLSFDTCFVGSGIVVVEYFSDCGFPFEPYVIWHQTKKQQSGSIKNQQIYPNASFFNCWIYLFQFCFIPSQSTEYILKLDSFHHLILVLSVLNISIVYYFSDCGFPF